MSIPVLLGISLKCPNPTFAPGMQVHTEIADFRGVKRPVLTTGTFDGVHRGHRSILQRLNEVARQEGGESVLFTFHPHPRMVLNPGDTDLKLLNTPAEKAALLEAAGLDHLLVVPFSRHFSQMAPEAYVHDLLVGAIGVRAIVIGYDHRFGRNREGNIDLLRSMGDRYALRVEEIPAQEVDHITVSSTKVRNALLKGDISTANELLGYSYPLSGVVVKGDQLGRTMGYPTANIGAIDPYKLVPGDGVYAVEVSTGGEVHGGMLYIGQRPTLSEAGLQRTVEVNIFGLDRDLYGETISVRFVEKIRGDIRFAGLKELEDQLHLDRTASMQRLAHLP